MREKLRNCVFAMLVGAGALCSSHAMAQKRDDILSVQRDVMQLQDQVKLLQAAQDRKMALLETLIQQIREQSGNITSGAASLERGFTDRLNEQQARVEAPMAVLGTKVDQSADELRSARENVTDLSRRLATLDNKVADVSSAVRTLNMPADAGPLPATGDSAAASGRVPAASPVSADLLWKKATRDFKAAKDKEALNEFAEFLKNFPRHANAAEAQYSMGLIYDRGKQYEDAAQVFQAVGERYPESPKAAEALYMKGVEYQKAGSKREAIAAYRLFIRKYPSHPDKPKAMARLKTLGIASSVSVKKGNKGQ